jgi:2-(1,2-epoxy-1,2-dihydrophenyl)acetyl-CoA isomerase
MGAMLFADRIGARQAADWGMIYQVVADADFDALWQARALALASGPTAAFAALKQALRASPGNSFAAQLAQEAQLQGRCGRTDDFREGVAAFLEKRPARFTGA